MVGALLLRIARVRVTAVYALAGAGLLAGGQLLIKAQDRVFEEEVRVANLKSMAMKRAVEAVEASGHQGAIRSLEDPELGARCIPTQPPGAYPARRYAGLPKQIDPLEETGGKWGRESPFKRQLFEYLARIGRQPAGVARILQQENNAGGGYYLPLLFDLKDWWNPMTDERRSRRQAIRTLLPGISQDYEEYIKTGEPCRVRPALLLLGRARASGLSNDGMRDFWWRQQSERRHRS